MGFIGEMQAMGKVLQEAGRIDLYEKLLSASEKMLELSEQNEALRRENYELKEKLKIKGSLVFKENMYFLTKEDGQQDGPFCSVCWQSDEKLVRLHSNDLGSIWCAVCRAKEKRRKR